MKKFIASTLTILVAAFILFAATEWKINFEKATIKFKMPAEEVDGTLTGLKGSFLFDENDLANSKIIASVDASTLNTGDKKRDDHLHTADFFDVKKFPTMTFTSTEIRKTEKGFTAIGSMKMKDRENKIEIPFTLETMDSGMVFKGSFDIFPSDFGVTNKPKDEAEKQTEKVIVNVEIPLSK